MSISRVARKGLGFGIRSGVSSFSGRKKASLAVASAAAMILPLIGSHQTAKAATDFWDPGSAGGTGSGGNGNWDPTATNWYNGTSDGVFSTAATLTFGGLAGTVNVDASVSPGNTIVFATSGYSIIGTSTVTLGTPGLISTGSLVGANESISTPILLPSTNDVVDGTLTFGGAILSNGKPILGAGTTATDPATYVFTGDMSQYTGTAFTVGGGNTVASLNHIVTMQYSSTVVSPTAGVGAGVFGGSTGQLALSYQANLDVTAPLNIAGELSLSGGGQQGLGDLSQNGGMIYGTASVNAGFNANNGANTTVANGISGNPPVAFVGGNTGNFLTNDLTLGNTLTIGQAGATTAAPISSTNAGRIMTFAGSGATVINSEIFDGNKTSLNYVNSILAYNGTGSLTLTNPLNNYKGATYIEQGTVMIGANNALPTGQGLSFTGNTNTTGGGGTPGLIMFGDLDPTKANGGVLDLAGFSQIVSGLGIQQSGTIPSALLTSTVTVGAANAAGTSSLLNNVGIVQANSSTLLTPYDCGLAVGEAISIGGQSGTIISLMNAGGTTASLNIGLSFDPAAGSYTFSNTPGPTSIAVTAGSATASNQIIGNSSTTSNSTLTFAGGNTVTAGAFEAGEGVSSTSTFGGTIEDSVNGGTMKVALNVTGGTLILSGTNTYTGDTTVTGGGTLQVSPGGTLGTTNVNVDASSILNLDGGTLDYDLLASGLTSTITDLGTLNVAGTNIISVFSTDSSLTPGVYDLITNPGFTDSSTSFEFSNMTTSETLVVGGTPYNLTITDPSTAVTLTVSPVPEPASLALLGLASLSILRRKRR